MLYRNFHTSQLYIYQPFVSGLADVEKDSIDGVDEYIDEGYQLI